MLAFSVLMGFALVAACGSEAGSEPGPNAGTASAVATADRGVFPPTATVTPPFAGASTGQSDRYVSPGAGIAGIIEWINSPPLALRQLSEQNRVALLDFWTYTCVNCVRTFPFLRAMHERYGDMGLTIIGVHSPEFEFERDPRNVLNAVLENGLKHPIAVDSDRATWDAFNNKFWPSTYLFSADGAVAYRHFGEGGYGETEDAIRRALEAAGRDLSGVQAGGEFEVPLAAGTFTITREIYGGYKQGYEPSGLFAAQSGYYLEPDGTERYTDAGLRRHGQFELQGVWRNEAEAIVHAGRDGAADGYLVFPFFATSVNAVLSREDEPAEVILEMDGRPLSPLEAGADVTFDADGRSVIFVDRGRMYRLVELDEFGGHELKLRTAAYELKLHNFTFGNYVEGP